MKCRSNEAIEGLSSRPVVLFDFDGTVVDTQPAILRTASVVLERRGYDVDELDLLPLIGPPLEEGFRMIADMDAESAGSAAAEYRQLFDETVTYREIPLMEGIPTLLEGLLNRGKRLAIATSRLQGATVELVSALGLVQFSAIAGRVPGERYSKAESIAAALDMLGATPDLAVMVGDRKYDVLGAAELGVPCIGIPSAAAVDGEMEDAGAIAVCRDAREVGVLLGVGR